VGRTLFFELQILLSNTKHKLWMECKKKHTELYTRRDSSTQTRHTHKNFYQAKPSNKQ